MNAYVDRVYHEEQFFVNKKAHLLHCKLILILKYYFSECFCTPGQTRLPDFKTTEITFVQCTYTFPHISKLYRCPEHKHFHALYFSTATGETYIRNLMSPSCTSKACTERLQNLTF